MPAHGHRCTGSQRMSSRARACSFKRQLLIHMFGSSIGRRCVSLPCSRLSNNSDGRKVPSKTSVEWTWRCISARIGLLLRCRSGRNRAELLPCTTIAESFCGRRRASRRLLPGVRSANTAPADGLTHDARVSRSAVRIRCTPPPIT